MALPLTMPSPTSGGNSPSSTDGSNGPQTPVSPDGPVQTLALPPPVDGSPATLNNNNASNAAASAAAAAAAAAKRKPSRRANTAERRATHNAVERQRRETLNSRFLDLAALLPNLSQIRRPSKSSIVNSSIAHIHASRRHRILAARELRLIKLESDALRRELNEWRDRAGLPRVEEPVRGDAFQMILSGEVEVINAGPIEEEDGGEYGADDYGDDEFGGMPPAVGVDDAAPEDIQMRAPMAHAAAVALLKHGGEGAVFAHNAPAQGLNLQTMLPRGARGHGQTPMIVQSPTTVSFENPAMVSLYEQHGAIPGPQFLPQYIGGQVDDKAAVAWGAHMYSMQNPQAAMFAPPAGPHGAPQGQQQQAAFFMNLQRHQALLQQQQQQQRAHGHVYGSPAEGDDASSVGSAAGGPRRERSGSMGSTGSGYGSPGSAGGYDMAGAVPRGVQGGAWDEGMAMVQGGAGLPMMKGQAVSVGGGGNGHGYASMML